MIFVIVLFCFVIVVVFWQLVKALSWRFGIRDD